MLLLTCHVRFCSVSTITRLYLVKEHPSCQAANYNTTAKYDVTLSVLMRVISGMFLWAGVLTQAAIRV